MFSISSPFKRTGCGEQRCLPASRHHTFESLQWSRQATDRAGQAHLNCATAAQCGIPYDAPMLQNGGGGGGHCSLGIIRNNSGRLLVSLGVAKSKKDIISINIKGQFKNIYAWEETC